MKFYKWFKYENSNVYRIVLDVECKNFRYYGFIFDGYELHFSHLLGNPEHYNPEIYKENEPKDYANRLVIMRVFIENIE